MRRNLKVWIPLIGAVVSGTLLFILGRVTAKEPDLVGTKRTYPVMAPPSANVASDLVTAVAIRVRNQGSRVAKGLFVTVPSAVQWKIETGEKMDERSGQDRQPLADLPLRQEVVITAWSNKTLSAADLEKVIVGYDEGLAELDSFKEVPASERVPLALLIVIGVMALVLILTWIFAPDVIMRTFKIYSALLSGKITVEARHRDEGKEAAAKPPPP
jgi:hypothetical protein